MPDSSTVYVIERDDEIIREIGGQLQIKRRSKKSDLAIMDWVTQRVKEYANRRIL